MAVSLEESLVVFGNSNHLSSFLAYYEGKIEENDESKKCLTDTPNYFAWIHFASEYLFYRIKEMVYWNEQDEKAFDWSYRKLLDSFISKHNPSVEQRDVILLLRKFAIC